MFLQQCNYINMAVFTDKTIDSTNKHNLRTFTKFFYHAFYPKNDNYGHSYRNNHTQLLIE